MKNIKKNIKLLFILVIALFGISLVNMNQISHRCKSAKTPNFEKIKKSVVSINSYSGMVLNKMGSGFIYKTDNNNAYILTNYHVVNNATNIKVYISEEEFVEAKVLGFSNYLDVAVIIIKNNNYEHLVLNDNLDISTGDKIYAVGTPLSNEFYNSVSSGIISNPSRLRIENNSDVDTLMDMIQMDITINPGNSGGPLLNERLEVIGICTSSINADNLNGISFAVPITSIIKKLELLESGELKSLNIGDVEIADTNDSEKLYAYGLIEKTNETSGVVILKDDNDNKLIKGDIIKKINNEEIKNITYYNYIINKYTKNENVDLTIVRNNKIKKIKVKLK